VGIVWTKINRQMKELEKPDDELIRQREQLKAEYERFKPDLEQVRTYYYDDPSNESLRERFESISQHQDSLLRQIRTIDGLLNVMPHGN
jgi:predicted RNase H-like nuclease (RuvC/YqgF family)